MTDIRQTWPPVGHIGNLMIQAIPRRDRSDEVARVWIRLTDGRSVSILAPDLGDACPVQIDFRLADLPADVVEDLRAAVAALRLVPDGIHDQRTFPLRKGIVGINGLISACCRHAASVQILADIAQSA